MRVIELNLVMMTLVLFFSCTNLYAAENSKISPHGENGDCAICHVAPVSKLRGWFVFDSTKREMKADLDQVCLKCHTIEPESEDSAGIGIGHATGKKLKINRQNLPLASDGTITCATTCHNMHPGSDNPNLQRKRLRLSVNELCMSCHNY